MKIYIARHGQDEDNAAGILNGRRDMPLTATGEVQARTVGEKIKDAGLKFDAVYTSPLRRTYQTAEIIGVVSGQPSPIILQDLIERDFGVMTGKPVGSIESVCAPDIIKTKIITYFLSPEGAETFPDLLLRAQGLLKRLESQHTQGAILLVTHGDFGKMIYASFYRLPWEQVLTGFHFGNSELLLLSQDSKPEDSHVFTIEQHNH